MNRARSSLTALAVIATLALSGCGLLGGSPEDADPPAASSAQADEGGAEAGVDEAAAGGAARVADSVMAEQTVDAPSSELGGELTTTLRSVEVQDEILTVRWALRWDSDDQPDDASASHLDLGIDWVLTATDPVGLVQYRPFCTEGSWKGGSPDPQQCSYHIVGSPRYPFDGFVNHATIEAFAQLPAPEGSPATIDVLPGQGLPVFTAAEITYLDGAE
ncbi:hypothetical protein [Cellulosimicrobium protaetiae]|uniref:Uncharacterized protein n=1 Tax=Cellulosimicrobium protaetiae TaxID=2587808 RepID=A0A6M5UH77_9MICO|nr:hypothetical protein [Cellulosimicrobium protaetiae]QJW37510.1 hypothetical protein FIC82_016295 [Cellulosimicrobium protaetiae]